jgi:hypothetical protein
MDGAQMPSVGWSFGRDEESFRKYVAPWLKSLPECEISLLARAAGDRPHINLSSMSMEYDGDYLSGMSEWEAFFHITQVALTWSGLRKMENEFSAWAMPEAQRIAAKISNVIPSAILEFARAEVESETEEKGDEEEEVEEE